MLSLVNRNEHDRSLLIPSDIVLVVEDPFSTLPSQYALSFVVLDLAVAVVALNISYTGRNRLQCIQLAVSYDKSGDFSR